LRIAHKLALWTAILGMVTATSLFAAPSKISTSKHPRQAVTSRPDARGGHSLDNQGGPDAFGYHYVDNQGGDTATYSWIELRGDPAATWLDFSNNPDDNVMTFLLWFNFPMYGLAYDTIVVSTNGNIQLETWNTAFSNECLPSGVIGGRMICVLWDDLHLDYGGYDPGGDRTVAYRDFGDHIVVEWDSVGPVFGDSASFKFEAILWADGRIKMQYDHLVNLEPLSQTIGLQSGGTGPRLQYVCDSSGHQPVNNLAIWFYPGPTGVIFGVVRDDHSLPVSLATVTINEIAISTQTDTDGDYAFPMVGVGTYSMTASRAGYLSQTIPNVVVNSGGATEMNFTLVWQGTLIFVSNDVPHDITDLDTAVSTLQVDSSLTIGDLDVQLNIVHTFDGDLWLALVSPQNDTVVLSAHRGEDGENYTNTIFDDEATTPIGDGTPPFTGSFIPDESLAAFDGHDAQGTWRLVVYDWSVQDEGQLVSWEIHVTPPSAAPEPVLAGAEKFALLDGYPNPFNSSTTLRYVLPREAAVNLTLYNTLGQEVRTLVSAPMAAGEHRAIWDGRDARGMDAATGMYLVRLEAAGRLATGKLLLLR
jgi:subtilisin-like proprotein convertase family protein